MTIPWEKEMKAAYKSKKERYADLAAGWRVFIFLVEVDCRGFTGTSTRQLLKPLGITEPKKKRAVQELARETEQGSLWIWLQ